MREENFSRILVVVTLGALVASSFASDKLTEGQTRDRDKRFAKSGWNLGELVSAPVIVIGRVDEVSGLHEAGKDRVFRVNVEEWLKEAPQGATIYLVEPPVADGRLEPPVLFPARYLLFLSAANNEDAAEKLNQIVGANRSVGLYTVYANWMGAVSLDSRWRELTNRRIDADYGRHALEELVPAVRSVCEYLRATEEEKQKLAEQFRNRGGLYKQFIDDALGKQRQPDR